MVVNVPVNVNLNATGGQGGVGAGALIGGVAGTTMKLIDALSNVASQSKILSMVQDTIGKALGLLIDVILMPFLPIITGAIILLYRGIMAFHTLWKGIWDTKAVQDIADALKKGFTILFDFLKGDDEKFFNILSWLYDIFMAKKSIPILFDLGIGIMPDILKSLFGKDFAIEWGKKALDFVINLTKGLNPLNWMIAVVKWIMYGDASDLAGQFKAIDAVVNFALGAGGWIADLLLGKHSGSLPETEGTQEMGMLEKLGEFGYNYLNPTKLPWWPGSNSTNVNVTNNNATTAKEDTRIELIRNGVI
jgi:hypothetical protein